jgi:hypothetical protein
MTDQELILYFNAHNRDNINPLVKVTANDYGYDGWLVMVGRKQSGALRCAVEDEHGRLFIHNAGQISLKTPPPA